MEDNLKSRIELIQNELVFLSRLMKTIQKTGVCYDLSLAEEASKKIHDMIVKASELFDNEARLIRLERFLKSEFGRFKYSLSKMADHDVLEIDNDGKLLAMIRVDEHSKVSLDIQKIVTREPFFIVLQDQIIEKFNVEPTIRYL